MPYEFVYGTVLTPNLAETLTRKDASGKITPNSSHVIHSFSPSRVIHGWGKNQATFLFTMYYMVNKKAQD
jgi:hypothetical protein